MKKFAGKYRIPSARAPWWNYANDGAYFVTICTAHRECCFGDVTYGEMHYSALGKIANNIWEEIPNQFPYAELGGVSGDAQSRSWNNCNKREFL